MSRGYCGQCGEPYSDEVPCKCQRRTGMSIKTGGPAFPNPARINVEGMTLRDYFAAKAMQAFLTADDIDLGLRGIADCAYKQADAMIKARGEQE